MSATTATPTSSGLEQDVRNLHARGDHDSRDIRPGEIAIGVIIGRSSEFFDFFVYAIASVLVFPSLVFPNFDKLTGTMLSFAVFALAFIARPIGSFVFMGIDRRHGRGVKLTIALFLLGSSTVAMAFLPGYADVGNASVILLSIFRIGQGLALGGAWDGLASLLALNAPEERRGWYAMIPQLGAPFGLILASGLFAFFLAAMPAADFLEWGWRYPFFVAFAINVVALFSRLRLVVTPAFEALMESRDLVPAPVGEVLRKEGKFVLLGAFAPLASFALFHMVTVFPLSWVMVFTHHSPVRFLIIEMLSAVIGVSAIVASGLIADRIGRRTLLGVSAAIIAAFSGFAPQLLKAGEVGEAVFMVAGFMLLGIGFGQASGVVSGSFSRHYRYTGSALTSDLAWMVGAGFAPLIALSLTAAFGLATSGLYLLSGSVATLCALFINKELAEQK